ncbi:hypothetical protein VTN02DRAFT_4868 [Thermoascus thermophilus]
MSKDSSPTYIHMHQPRLADFFEDFTRPHTSVYASLASSSAAAAAIAAHHHTHHPHHASATVTYGSSAPATVPSFLPVEDIYVPPQHQPLNPEDEDDVIPDQHAAFGITRAMESRREAVWRDLGLEELVRGVRQGGIPGGAAGAAGGRGTGVGGGPALVGQRGWRPKAAGALMGGRRTVCLR